MTRLVLSWAVLLSLLISAAALGQPFPARPIRMVVPFEAGGSMDAVGRALVEPWAGNLKQRIVIDNRGGAGGTVGTTIVAQAPFSTPTWGRCRLDHRCTASSVTTCSRISRRCRSWEPRPSSSS